MRVLMEVRFERQWIFTAIAWISPWLDCAVSLGVFSFWRRLSFESSMPNAVCLLTPESKASRLAIPERQMLVSTTTLLRASCTTTTTSCRENRQYRVSFFYYRGYRDSTTQQSPNTEKTASTIRRCSCMSCGRLVHSLQTAQSGMCKAREMEMRSASSYSRRFHSLASYIHTCSAGLPFMASYVTRVCICFLIPI
jgi:hypothetical protein